MKTSTPRIVDGQYSWFNNPDRYAPPVTFHRYMNPAAMPLLGFGDFTGSYSYLGPDYPALGNDAADFCINTACVVGNVQSLFTAFLEHIRSEHLTAQHSALWLSVRISEPSNVFDLPHWHQDDAYFSTHPNEYAFKISTVFAGPPTMFFQSPDKSKRPVDGNRSEYDICEAFKWHAYGARAGAFNMDRVVHRDYIAEQPWRHTRPKLQADDYIARRIGVENSHWRRAREYAAEVTRELHVKVPSRGEAARWIVGDEERGTVHSEPAFTTHRLFVSVLPGTERQIRRLCGLWGEEYGKSYQPDFGGDVQAEYAQVSMTYPLGVDANYL